MVLYGHRIEWTEFNGNRSSLRVENCLTREEALDSATQSAIGMGWTPPKWWQWWRWNDTRVERPS